jgi:glycosyltransferase involved in cell wall biosynthesis
MKVLGLCSYPVEAAATRYRLVQFVAPLAEKGIELKVRPFLNSAQFKHFYNSGGRFSKIVSLASPLIRRTYQNLEIKKYDMVLVQREAMFFGPAIFERLYQIIGRCPLILDLDDATYISYVSPTYGKLGSFFKFFGKTDKLIKRADAVFCGNRFIAEYVEKKGTKAEIVPTVVDTGDFFPVDKRNDVPVVGWIGTHSTFPFLESIFPVLEDLARKYRFKLKIVGAGRETVQIKGVETENLDWNLEREIEDFQSLDIGLYPIRTSKSANEEWIKGKSGFKAIQYMSVGIPYVVTPIGICAEMGIEGATHFAASNERQWHDALETLLASPDRRGKMGEAGRKYALENYTVEQQTEKIAKTFRDILEYSR